MSKKVRLSFPDYDYKMLETEAAERGLTVLDLVKEAYQKGRKENKKDKLLECIKELKNFQNGSLNHEAIMLVCEIFLRQTSYSYEFMKYVLNMTERDKKKGEEIENQVNFRVREQLSDVNEILNKKSKD